MHKEKAQAKVSKVRPVPGQVSQKKAANSKKRGVRLVPGPVSQQRTLTNAERFPANVNTPAKPISQEDLDALMASVLKGDRA